jgi:putative FmdB family regulatory protein
MPIYEYECPKHGQYEVSQRITEPALTACTIESCGQPVRKLISHTSFALKGGANSGAKADDKKADDKKADDKKADAKPETKTESKEASPAGSSASTSGAGASASPAAHA